MEEENDAEENGSSPVVLLAPAVDRSPTVKNGTAVDDFSEPEKLNDETFFNRRNEGYNNPFSNWYTCKLFDN